MTLIAFLKAMEFNSITRRAASHFGIEDPDAIAPAADPAEKARVLYAAQAPFNRTLVAGKTAHAAWRSKPSWYAVSTEDRTINPDLERFMAKRMGAKTIEVKSSHLSLISQPDVIANLILDAAGQA